MAETDADPAHPAETSTGGIAAPDTVVLSARSLAGPFAGLRRSRRLRLPPINVPLVSTAATAVTIAEATADPLRDVDSGVESGGQLDVQVDPATIEPGRPGRLILSGLVPAIAGRYASALRLGPVDEQGGRLVVPLSLNVAASPIWGLACMVLGLVALGMINVLGAESALRGTQRDLLQSQQAFHERIERTPVPQSRQEDVTAIDREYATALGRLTAVRSVGVLDHRLLDAEPHLHNAEQMQADLNHAVGGGRPGAAELDDLLADWKTYQDVVRDLGQLAGAGINPAIPGPSLAARVDAYQLRFAQRFLRLPINYNGAQLQDLMLQLRLAAAAGRSDEARSRALLARRWLQRAEDDLAHGLLLVNNQKLLGFDLVSNALQVQQHLDHDDLPADRKAAIQALLDDAAAQLAPPPPASGHADDLAMSAANRLVNRASVALTRARADAMLERFHAAITQADTQTGMDDVGAVVAAEQAAHPTTPEQKIAGLGRILDVWRTKITTVPDAAVRAGLATHIDAVAAVLAKGDLKGLGPPYKALLDAWTAWGMHQVQQATGAILSPYCEQDKQGDLVRVAQITESLRQQEPRPQLVQWEQELDRIRAETLRVDPADTSTAAACRTVLQALEERMITLSNDIFRRQTLDTAIPASAQRAALTLVGLDATVLARPRLLTLDVQAPANERVVGRRLLFTLGNRDPAWGAGATVAVDFGDGSPPLREPAEALARGTPIEHEYATPMLARLRVAVADRDDPFAADTAVLGAGTASLAIRPSAITAAEALSDVLWNARFALALLIAGTVYYWRFHTGKKVFGARGFDYVEAFALGFLVNAVVADLPAQIARIAELG